MEEEFSITKFLLDAVCHMVGDLGGTVGEKVMGFVLKKMATFLEKQNTYNKYIADGALSRRELIEFFNKLYDEINPNSRKNEKQAKNAEKQAEIMLSEFCLYSGITEEGIKAELNAYKTYKDIEDNDLKQAIVDVLFAMRKYYSEGKLSEDNKALLSLLCSDDVTDTLAKQIVERFAERVSLVSGGTTFKDGAKVVVKSLELTKLECPKCGKGLLEELRSSTDGKFRCSGCKKEFVVSGSNFEQANDYLQKICKEINVIGAQLKDINSQEIAEEVFSKVQSLLEENLLNSEELENKLENSRNEIIEKLEKYINKILDNAEQNKKEVIEKVDESKLETITHINSSTDWLSKINRLNSIFPESLSEAISKFNGYFSRCKNCEDKDKCDYFYSSDYYKIWNEYNNFRSYDYSAYDNDDKKSKEQICNIFNKAKKCINELNDITISRFAACPEKHNPENKREKAINQPETETPAPQVSDPTPIGADCIVVCDCGAYVLVNKKDTEISADGYIMRIENDPETTPSDSDSETIATEKEHIEITNIFNTKGRLLCPFCGNPISPTAKFLCDGRNISVKDYKEGKNELIFPNSFYADFKQNGRKGEYKITLTRSSSEKGVFIVPKEYTEIYGTDIHYQGSCMVSLLKIIFMGIMKEIKCKYNFRPFYQVNQSRLIEFYNDGNSAGQEKEIFDEFTLINSRRHNYLKFKK